MKLNIELRNNTGKKATKQLRRNSKIPAVLYGKDFASIPLAIDYKEFYHFHKQSLGHQSFVFLKVNDKESRTLIREIQIDPFSRKIMHIDFQEIYAGQKIEVKIPISTVGDAPGVMEGGIVDMHLRELEVKCLPKDLPDSFEVDISKLKIGNSIHVEGLVAKFPNVEILHPPSAPIISVVLPKGEAVVLAEEGEKEEVLEEAKKEKETVRD